MQEFYLKTIYFPKHRVRSGVSAKITISLPKNKSENLDSKKLFELSKLDSANFRQMLGDPFVEDLEEKAKKDKTSISNACLEIIKASPNKLLNQTDASQKQLSLNFYTKTKKESESSFGVTFKDNFRQGAHGWYPYLEGFSATYATDALIRYGKPKNVYDPFAGSGTTQLAASLLSIPSFYTELNPFMNFVSETKVISSNWARNNFNKFLTISNKFIEEISSTNFIKNSEEVSLDKYHEAFPGRDYFFEQDIRQLLAAVELAKNVSEGNKHIESILLLSCATNIVKSSNMTRRSDLRRRRDNEYKNRVVNVPKFIRNSLKQMILDVENLPKKMAHTQFVSNDAKDIPPNYHESFDFALTSPPYLNGTGYFRNTKLELWIMSFINSEKDLSYFRDLTVTGAINDISKKDIYEEFIDVESIAKILDKEAKDKRIPRMVRDYFSDMYEVMNNVHRSLVPGAKFLLDIGDSRFYGVHVQTDELLISVAKKAGFKVIEKNILAKRMSKDKHPLIQAEIVFEKPKRKIRASAKTQNLKEKIKLFQKSLPYKNDPYSKKNWGHPLHSLCSYQGKLKPAIAHFLIKEFVKKEGRILDPLGGVGTIALEGAMLGHHVVTNDKSPFPAIIAKSKLNPTKIRYIESAIEKLKQEIKQVRLTKEDYESANFGLNSAVKDFYHPDNLKELLKLRKLFLAKQLNQRSSSENFVWSCLLHILHGNRPYALSRTSHPITPFSPKGPAVYKDIFTKILERAQRALKEDIPDDFKRGIGYLGDFRDLPEKINYKFDAIITSPPFYGMRFDRPNWLRMWFCGWGDHDFKTKSKEFLERQQTKDINVYRDFFRVSKLLLKRDGILVLHLGSGGKKDLVTELKDIGGEFLDLQGEISENVETITKHGILDKGLTKFHTYLFFKL